MTYVSVHSADQFTLNRTHRIPFRRPHKQHPHTIMPHNQREPHVIPIRDDRESDWPTEADPCWFDKRFDHLVGNRLRSDMFVFVATNGQRVPAHKFAVGTATVQLKRLLFDGPPDGTKPLPVLSSDLVTSYDGRPMLILNDLAPEHCHQVSN